MVFCHKCGAENKEGSKFCIKCGAALAAAERGVHVKMKYCFVGSLITSLVGAIMLLTFPFATWVLREEMFYLTYSIYWNSTLSRVIIGGFVALLLYGAYVSYLGLRSGETPLPPGKLKRAFYGATTVFLGCLIGGMIFIMFMDSVDPTYWELGEGFLYGGVICGGLTAGLLAIAYRMRRRG